MTVTNITIATLNTFPVCSMHFYIVCKDVAVVILVKQIRHKQSNSSSVCMRTHMSIQVCVPMYTHTEARTLDVFLCCCSLVTPMWSPPETEALLFY